MVQSAQALTPHERKAKIDREQDLPVMSQGVLIVKGVREDGRRELLAVEVADTENEVTYEDLFRRLRDRGLVKAIQKHFQRAA